MAALQLPAQKRRCHCVFIVFFFILCMDGYQCSFTFPRLNLLFAFFDYQCSFTFPRLNLLFAFFDFLFPLWLCAFSNFTIGGHCSSFFSCFPFSIVAFRLWLFHFHRNCTSFVIFSQAFHFSLWLFDFHRSGTCFVIIFRFLVLYSFLSDTYIVLVSFTLFVFHFQLGLTCMMSCEWVLMVCLGLACFGLFIFVWVDMLLLWYLTFRKPTRQKLRPFLILSLV